MVDLLQVVETQLLYYRQINPDWCKSPKISEITFDGTDNYTFTRGGSSMTLRLVTNYIKSTGKYLAADVHDKYFPDLPAPTSIVDDQKVLIGLTDNEWFDNS